MRRVQKVNATGWTVRFVKIKPRVKPVQWHDDAHGTSNRYCRHEFMQCIQNGCRTPGIIYHHYGAATRPYLLPSSLQSSFDLQSVSDYSKDCLGVQQLHYHTPLAVQVNCGLRHEGAISAGREDRYQYFWSNFQISCLSCPVLSMAKAETPIVVWRQICNNPRLVASEASLLVSGRA